MMSHASSSLSSSTTTTLLSQGYDVFLSFRGADTRTHFISHLYEALTRSEIRTYKDDKTLERGSFIAPELLAAIEASRFAVVVLSNNFATSKWCLVEIAKVVDCLEGGGKLIVIPVFYHVSPSDMSRQSGCFEQGFANHEANPEITPQIVETWRAAFAKLGKIAGFHVTEQSNEAEVINEIVKRILKDQLQYTLPIDLAKSLVGIESRADEVKRILRMDSSEVLFIGISGMSGIGKTTLAEAVYKGIRYKFQRSSFIENIKDISKQNDSTDLRMLQQKLLHDLLKDESVRVQNVDDGQTLLGTKLRGLKVMIVLDDVNHLDQLTYLAGGREWFGPGSRIIVTTTNTGLLNAHKINEIHSCEEMDDDEALSLFSQSAFEQAHPAHGYEELSDDIVKLAGGLPLALRVYGKLLCGQEENYWKDMIKKLREYPDKEVLGRLEVVYARLESFQQKTFIYIACFLKGRSINLVKDILKNIGLYPECGIPDLINKFLITINDEDNVWMHDLLQQMCWEILGKESHRNAGCHVAIKRRQDILDILSSAPKETQTVEIINQEPFKVDVDDRLINPACFSKMVKLKFLRISNLHFRQGLNNLSSDLRILEWYGCSLKSFPSTFEPTNIYELEMCSSQLEALWAKDLDLPNLRSINLSFSKNLTRLPDLTSTSNLVRLNLEGCTKLTKLHESVLLQKRLLYMNLKGCTNLQSLGRSIMEMDALETLRLSGCSNLEYIPELGENMKRLEHLYVDGTSIKKLPDNLGELSYLKTLKASGTYIVELPSSIHRLKKLRFLHVNGCRQLSLKTGCFLNTHLDTVLSSSLRELDLSYCSLSVVPDGIRWLYCLITLNLSGNDFVSLPPSICLLSKLRMLCLNDCKRLRSLPKLSLVDEDMDYGPRNRFDYYVSSECIDVSRFRASDNNSFPTVSCVNCRKLSEKKRGSYLAERILNNYLQLRTKYWITPKAVFVIFGAGSEIPSRFVQPSSDDLILEGPWVGVAICAVVNASHHVDGHTETKYVVTAHIHFGEKHCNIAIPVNFFMVGLENQLVFYWTETDDLQRINSSSQIKNKFSVTFSVEPGDGNLQVTKFGVCFIHKEYIPCLKRHEDSLTAVMKDYKCPYKFHADYKFASTFNTYFRSSNWTVHHDHFWKMMGDVTCDSRKQGSMDVIHNTVKALLEINQEFFKVLSLCKRELKNKMFVYCYYEISIGASVLYQDFVQSLTNINDDWLGVKWTLEKILAKRRAGDFKEILEQLNDLEASQSVGFSDNFIIMFISIYIRALDTIYNFFLDFGGKLMYNKINVFAKKKVEQRKELGKISIVTIAGVFCMMAAFMGDYDLLKQMKNITRYYNLFDVIQFFVKKKSEWLKEGGQYMKTHCNWELGISNFHENAILVQELTNKMARSGCFTKENEEEMIMVINKLQENIEKVSHTIDDMSSQADEYSRYIKAARKHINSYSRFSETHVTVISKLSLFD